MFKEHWQRVWKSYPFITRGLVWVKFCHKQPKGACKPCAFTVINYNQSVVSPIYLYSKHRCKFEEWHWCLLYKHKQRLFLPVFCRMILVNVEPWLRTGQVWKQIKHGLTITQNLYKSVSAQDTSWMKLSGMFTWTGNSCLKPVIQTARFDMWLWRNNLK